jgi:hypothetical protein
MTNTRRPLNNLEEQAWDLVGGEPCTREDWEDLFFSLEEYKRRFIKRHIEAHITADAAEGKGSATPTV